MMRVTAAIIFHNSRVLAARRAPHKHMGGYWEFPGGKVEPWETPEESLIREISEELGISIEIRQHFLDNEHHYGDNRILLMTYFCSWLSGELELHEHDEIYWCTASDICRLNWAPADIPIAGALKTTMEVMRSGEVPE